MTLALYGHPFSSYTQKVLISLYENATPFEFREIGPDAPQHIQEWMRRWPLMKFPMLLDGDHQVVETSIIIEYLQLNHPGPARLIRDDREAALDVRFLDRFFDLHVMDAMQVAVAAKIGQVPMTSEDGLALARQRLDRAYGCLRATSPAGYGRSARTTRWPIAPPGRRFSMLTGPTRFRTPTPTCAPTAPACSPARPLPVRSMRRATSVLISR